jgi:hypothetical protein
MAMRQLNLLDIPLPVEKWKVSSFPANNFREQIVRLNLEQKLINITAISNDFNKQSVSSIN